MDPKYRRELEQRPKLGSLLKNFARIRTTAAKFPDSPRQVSFRRSRTRCFHPQTTLPCWTMAQKTGCWSEAYHEQHVQPSFNMSADTIALVSNPKAPSVLRALNLHQLQLGNLEGETCYRTIVLHNLPLQIILLLFRTTRDSFVIQLVWTLSGCRVIKLHTYSFPQRGNPRGKLTSLAEGS